MSTATYPIDSTGTDVNNLVQGEPHVLPNAGVRVFTLNFGAFYVDSLQLFDVAANKPLAANQFYATWRYKVPTSKYKKDICGLIVVTDPTVGTNLLVTYQVVGGPYSTPETDVVAMLTRRVPNARPAAWGALLAPPPALTTKDFTDKEFDFARLENILDQVAQTLVYGGVNNQDAIMAYADTNAAAYLVDNPPAISQDITNHVTAADDHVYYLKKTELASVLPALYSAVRRPKNVTPSAQATGVAVQPLLVGNTYRALYGIPQAQFRVQVSTSRDFSTLVLDQTINQVITQWQLTSNLANQTKYYWRICYQSIDGDWSPWSTTTFFTTA